MHLVFNYDLYYNLDSIVTRLRYWRGNGLDSQGSSPGWAPLRSGLGQAILILVCLCHQAVYNLPPDKRGDLFGWESNRGPGGR